METSFPNPGRWAGKGRHPTKGFTHIFSSNPHFNLEES